MSKQVTKSEVDLKSLQNGKFFSMVRIKRALKPRKILSVLGNTHTNCSFENVKLILFLTNNVSKIFSMRELTKFFLGRGWFSRLTIEYSFHDETFPYWSID